MPQTLTFRALDSEEHAAWYTLVRASAQGTVYHESPWLNAVPRMTGKPIVIYGIFAGEHLAAGAPLQLRRRGPFRTAQRAWATPYAGIVAHPDAWNGFRCELRNAAQRFTHFLKEIAAQHAGRLYAARMPDDRLCAACLMVFDRRRAYYSLSASDAALRKNGSASLLVWAALQDLFETFDELDLGGASMPHIVRFKSRFGGMRIEYIEATAYRTRIECIAIDSYHRGRGLSLQEAQNLLLRSDVS